MSTTLQAQPSLQTQLVKAYPYFSLASLGVLQRLAESTSSQHGPGSLSAIALASSGGAGGVAQGNPLAMRALMDALGASAEQPSSQGVVGDGGSEGLLLGEVGASGEEREALLDAFGGLRCVRV